MRSRRSEDGFSLIEQLVSVVVIGVLSTIMIPNLLTALHRGRQKRTMADIRTVGTAIESYMIDHSFFPTAADMPALTPLVKPTFIGRVPDLDGWGRVFTVSATATTYTIGSGGRDGGGLTYIGGPTTSIDDAIIFADGHFAQWPEGAQK